MLIDRNQLRSFVNNAKTPAGVNESTMNSWRQGANGYMNELDTRSQLLRERRRNGRDFGLSLLATAGGIAGGAKAFKGGHTLLGIGAGALGAAGLMGSIGAYNNKNRINGELRDSGIRAYGHLQAQHDAVRAMRGQQLRHMIRQEIASSPQSIKTAGNHRRAIRTLVSAKSDLIHRGW